uniref:Uncharacterized protein n=1 Tax=Chromera velia CCMP2878 TaxID=1169474 RepID=A0A0G4HYA9_9ALVE|eukprot:Cvel_9460.t1-p1 / transcript=Cvel_9460.t1 / gene=Cvel_9460 / organism=Chromera_velia_CCMP2878 / gene_product=hypothetical protein / transcript_product=hypothetical protein / location=Cvel_scaffold546:1309-2649(+) / protein_length=195 / sequence_SO=supercontig / SO=protein_coding / is_pseudo=false
MQPARSPAVERKPEDEREAERVAQKGARTDENDATEQQRAYAKEFNDFKKKETNIVKFASGIQKKQRGGNREVQKPTLTIEPLVTKYKVVMKWGKYKGGNVKETAYLSRKPGATWTAEGILNHSSSEDFGCPLAKALIFFVTRPAEETSSSFFDDSEAIKKALSIEKEDKVMFHCADDHVPLANNAESDVRARGT